jgi:hypothetical protein
MIYWLIAAASLTAYLFVGWRIAMNQLPAAWTRARKEWHAEDMRRGSVRGQTTAVLFFWPLVLTARAIRGHLDQVIDARDPVALAAKITERDRRIAQLERDLGYTPVDKDRP